MIRPATPADVPTIAQLIRDLAEYERLADKVVAEGVRPPRAPVRPRPYCEVLLAEDGGKVVGFALFFHNYSTFLGKPGIYLEDLFVKPEHRGKGHGKGLLVALAKLAVERDCGRVEWSVLNWNEPSIEFYKRSAPGRWTNGPSIASRANRSRGWPRRSERPIVQCRGDENRVRSTLSQLLDIGPRLHAAAGDEFHVGELVADRTE